MDKNRKNSKNTFYPPVVAVLGHVDHGKTTLLDAIRKTNVAVREHGGITQKIGASQIEVNHEGNKRKITFIDTPGHEAFTNMRGRGVAAADIGLLIVSSVDGVMPQTLESIKLLKGSSLPFIVVLTKIDDPQKLPEKAKQQLTKEGILLEEYGGDVPLIEVSAKDGTNIAKLLDLIILVYDMKRETNFYPFSEEGNLMGIVIESNLDQQAGPRATVIIKNGRVKLKDEVFSGDIRGKVKSLISDHGNLNEATVGDAVEILGFEKVPGVGSLVTNTAKPVEELSYREEKTKSLSPFDEEEDQNMLSIILCADNQGSIEAIKHSIPQNVNFVIEKTGDVEVSDVLFAKSTGAIILGFNIKIKADVATLARTEKVLVKNYAIIYEMIDEITEFVQGKLDALKEEIYGIAKIMASFPFDKTKVCGVKVTEGRLAKSDKVRLIRNDEVVGETRINSLRQGKDQVSKIEAGDEGGVILSPFLDFTIGDVLISHN
jgi:translation initiation factor IF-2